MVNEATQLDALNLDVLVADVRIKLREGDLSEARMHLESLLEVASTLGGGPKISLLQGQVAWASKDSPVVTVDQLDEALTQHLDSMTHPPANGQPSDLVLRLDPSTTLDMVQLMLWHVGGGARR